MARGLSIVLCFAVATAFELKVDPLPDLDGRGVSFEISPNDLEVNLTWCEVKYGPSGCESMPSVTGGVNVTSLQPNTKYNVSAETLKTNETEIRIFSTTYGTPTTLFNITVTEVDAFWIALSWTPMNSLKLNGPPTGYRIVYCNTTCDAKETDEPEVVLGSLRPQTTYTIRMWAFNIDHFHQRLENDKYVTIIYETTAPDSRTSLIFVIVASVGVFVFVAGLIIYMRKSRRIRRRAHQFNMVKTYDESYSATSTRNSL